MAKILISGGTGFIGRALVQELTRSGHQVWLLSRRPGPKSYVWNPKKKEIDPQALPGTEIIIHLAGAPVAGKRWTATYRQEIIDSRVESTRFLYQLLHEQEHQVHSFIAASASGYYGENEKAGITEDTEAGTTFLASVCAAWEQESMRVASLGIRVALVRIGIVMGADGGFIATMKLPVQLGLAATLGRGHNKMPWIALQDLSGIFCFLAEHKDAHGVFNAASPEVATQKELIRELARTLKRPYILPGIPSFLLRMALGAMADEMLLSTHLSADKIQKAGYTFRYPRLSECLAHELLP